MRYLPVCRWLLAALLLSGITLLPSGCNSPAGKAAGYKAKKVSPVHDTKVEKAGKEVKSAKKDVEKKVEGKDGLPNR
jgi:hypothetical protein